MRIIELESMERPSAEILGRTTSFNADIQADVAEIIAAVRERGDEAVLEYTQKFDNVKLDRTRFTDVDIQYALNKVNEVLTDTLEAVAERVTSFHQNQLEKSWFEPRIDGSIVGSKVTPLESVGIYAPGGRAIYPSTVIMNAIPARVAGVRRIVLATPPREDGLIDPSIIAAAHIAGVTEIHRVGGAQAIAALAYGTEGIKPVDKIVGPGNAYVAAAKRQVFGDVGIDMIAGPSEVMVLADETAEPALVAIDLMAQAEHDPDAKCYLVTLDETLVDLVLDEIDEFLLDSPRAEITQASLDNNGIIFVAPDLSTALLAINTVAPEHLEIHMESPFDLLGLIDNAGAIFLGQWTPECVGDYIAGPNHTLPTNGTARFSSPLSVRDFLKHTSIIGYTYAALKLDLPVIDAMASREKLWAHGKSARARIELMDSLMEEDDED